MSRRNPHVKHWYGSWAVAVGLCLALAACSSSSSSGAAAGVASSSSAGTQSAASAAGSLAQAAAAASKLEQVQAQLPVTTPLRSRPASGKLVVFVSCNVECELIGNGVQAAATAVGWKFRQLLYSPSDPSTLISALRQALQYKPSVVMVGGLPEVLWRSVLPAYKAAGVPIVTFSATATVDSTVLGEVIPDAQYETYGVGLADWFIADSKGKGHAYFSAVDDLPQFRLLVDAFSAEVKAKCPSCTVTKDSVSVAAVNSGGAVPATVSALQRDPSINYVFTVNGAFYTGLAGQLSSLGLANRVKIGGVLATAANEANIRIGKEAAYVNYSITIIGWMMMDIALRHMEGMPVPASDSAVPYQLLTSGSHFTVSNSLDVPTDYAGQFKKLWKVQ